MSMREIDRFKTIQAVVDGNLKPGLAAQRLRLTARQVQRLVRHFCGDGAAGLLSRQRAPRAFTATGTSHFTATGTSNNTRATGHVRDRRPQRSRRRRADDREALMFFP